MLPAVVFAALALGCFVPCAWVAIKHRDPAGLILMLPGWGFAMAAALAWAFER